MSQTLKTKRPIYILSIAGGGVRGTITAQFLKRLEENINVPIIDQFDMFAGTSIGSLILGSLIYTNTPANTLSDKIFTVSNAQKIMNKTWWDYIFGKIQSNPYYDGKGKREIIHKHVQDKIIGETNKKVMFATYDIDQNQPKFFKSWDEYDKETKVKDVVDASSAAPCFFPSVKIGDKWYMDGGICANYPTDCVYADALKIFGKDADIRVLCIGTGYPKFKDVGAKSEKWGLLPWLSRGDLLEIFTDSAERTTNYRMETFTDALGHKFLRVNGYIDNTSIDDVSSENIQKLKDIGDQWWDIYSNEVMELLTN